MDQERAYADAVGAVLDAVPHAAQQRFDAALDELVAAGRLEAGEARRLRWLQRETGRAVRDHATEALPSLLGGLVRAAERVVRRASTREADAARAGGQTVTSPADRPTQPHEEAVNAPPAGTPAVTDQHRRRLIVAGLRAADPTPRRLA